VTDIATITNTVLCVAGLTTRALDAPDVLVWLLADEARGLFQSSLDRAVIQRVGLPAL